MGAWSCAWRAFVRLWSACIRACPCAVRRWKSEGGSGWAGKGEARVVGAGRAYFKPRCAPYQIRGFTVPVLRVCTRHCEQMFRRCGSAKIALGGIGERRERSVAALGVIGVVYVAQIVLTIVQHLSSLAQPRASGRPHQHGHSSMPWPSTACRRVDLVFEDARQFCTSVGLRVVLEVCHLSPCD